MLYNTAGLLLAFVVCLKMKDAFNLDFQTSFRVKKVLNF